MLDVTGTIRRGQTFSHGDEPIDIRGIIIRLPKYAAARERIGVAAEQQCFSRGPAAVRQECTVSRSDQPGPVRPRREAGPCVHPNHGIVPMSGCNGRAPGRFRNRCLWQPSPGFSSIAVPPAATAQLRKCDQPAPQLRLSAPPPGDQNAVDSRHTGRSIGTRTAARRDSQAAAEW